MFDIINIKIVIGSAGTAATLVKPTLLLWKLSAAFNLR